MARILRAKGWAARPGEYIMCPVPECCHMGLVITKMHGRLAHSMEQEEITELYGMPYRVLKKRGGR